MSRIHLPGFLCSRGITRVPRYYEASDSCEVSSHQAGLPDSQHTAFQTYRHQPHLQSFPHHSPIGGVASRSTRFWFGASPLCRRLADIKTPNRVRHPTVYLFISCCSPPRLATTQLRLISDLGDPDRTFTDLTMCAFRRTAGDVPVAKPTLKFG